MTTEVWGYEHTHSQIHQVQILSYKLGKVLFYWDGWLNERCRIEEPAKQEKHYVELEYSSEDEDCEK